jgi:enoyl-CoA hydratase/carnithine racemase
LIVQRVRTSDHAWGTSVELCAPERRNALDQRAVAELRDAFTADGHGAVLLCAEGPAFCAGGDVGLLAAAAAAGDLTDLLMTNAAAFADAIEAIITCPRPVVVAVDGPAVGGGASLVLACDVRLATPRARLVFGWGRWGLPPDGCVTATLAAAVGSTRARSLLMEGADVGADADVASRLFSRVVAVDRLAEEAVEVVAALAESAGARATKAAAAALFLPVLRAQREAELAAIARVAADTATGDRLAMLYKIDR